MPSLDHLKEQDPAVFNAIRGEMLRQEEGLELIASENFVSRAVLEAAGTVLTNKYAEGMPGRRYYGGCAQVDIAERLAEDRALELFGAEYANMQPHSGTQANMAVYMVVLNPGDTMLAMDLDSGGHLTHGSPVNFSGRLYNIAAYSVRKDNERIDYEELERKAKEHRPKLIVAGASAYPYTLDYERFAHIAKSVDALFMVDMAHIAGLVATGVHPSPIPHADFVTSTTHKTLRGPRGGMILAKGVHRKALNSGVCPRIQGGPLMHVIAAKAVALKEAQGDDFKTYQQQVCKNARALAVGLASSGFRMVGSSDDNPGTDTHLILVDLRAKGITGKVAEKALDIAGITVNKNKIPFDPEKPLVTSGIRLGTPALTTRGMKENTMAKVAALIARALTEPDNETHLQTVREEVEELSKAYPLYRDLIQSL